MSKKSYKKKDYPVEKIRRFLEPGPLVLLSSAHRGRRDIMTMGWHMVMMDEPRYPTTVHYRGDGVIMVSGRNVSYRRLFKPENL